MDVLSLETMPNILKETIKHAKTLDFKILEEKILLLYWIGGT